MAEIVINEKGQKVVEIDTIIFSGKRKIDWDGVEQYLKKYVGESYQIDETDDLVYIGSDFPDEYAHSKYNNRALGTVGKAKANASQVIPELIKIAMDISFSENFEQKHSHDAKYGWYYCIIRFTLPVTNDQKEVIGRNNFQGRMVIRCNQDGKKYLYDIVDIKKNVVPRLSKSCTVQNHTSLRQVSYQMPHSSLRGQFGKTAGTQCNFNG